VALGSSHQHARTQAGTRCHRGKRKKRGKKNKVAFLVVCFLFLFRPVVTADSVHVHRVPAESEAAETRAHTHRLNTLNTLKNDERKKASKATTRTEEEKQI